MANERDIRENTRALIRLAQAMETFNRFGPQLSKNLAALGAKLQVLEKKGECSEYFCFNGDDHEHGSTCTNLCPCGNGS